MQHANKNSVCCIQSEITRHEDKQDNMSFNQKENEFIEIDPEIMDVMELAKH